MLDALISVVIFLIQRLLLPVLPTSLPFLPINTFSESLYSAQINLIPALSGLGLIFNVPLLFGILSAIMIGELSLIIFKIGTFVINVARGSGA